MRNANKWHLFLISIGFLLIAISPTLPNKLITLLTGALTIAIGFMLIIKNK